MYDIVAVDDSDLIRGLLGRVFERFAWNVRICSRAAEAEEAVRSAGTRLLVTDINMPGMSGATLARRMREFAPKMPIIALTASVEESDLNPADFTEVMIKPFRVSALIQTVAKYLVAAHAQSDAGSAARGD